MYETKKLPKSLLILHSVRGFICIHRFRGNITAGWLLGSHLLCLSSLQRTSYRRRLPFFCRWFNTICILKALQNPLHKLLNHWRHWTQAECARPEGNKSLFSLLSESPSPRLSIAWSNFFSLSFIGWKLKKRYLFLFLVFVSPLIALRHAAMGRHDRKWV